MQAYVWDHVLMRNTFSGSGECTVFSRLDCNIGGFDMYLGRGKGDGYEETEGRVGP
jgi:hypothetical protein